MRTPTPAHPRQGLPFRRSQLAVALACVLAGPAMAATYTVIDTSNTTGPTVPIGCPSGCSLAQAIQAAVSACDTNATIAFAIPAGPFVISPAQAFPAVSNNCPTVQTAIVIDGGSQAGASANTQSVGFNAVNPIVIDGTFYNSFACALSTANFGYGEGGLWIKGLEIRNFTYGGSPAICNAISGQGAAVKVTGSRILNNASGMHIHAPSQIGGGGFANRNIISGNTGNSGIIASGIGSISISDNYIGTTDSGTSPNPNGFGVSVDTADSGLAIQGNVISGNNFTALTVLSSSGAKIQSNLIGVGPGGVSVANGGDAMGLSCVNTSTISGNQIGANAYGGIFLGASTGNTIQSNTIGFASAPNGGDGISLGTATCGPPPLMAPIEKGLASPSGANTIDSNTINFNTGRGVGINSSNGNTVRNNTITSNGIGVQIVLGNTNKITQNSIFGNTGKNIDLDFYGGALPNDPLDTDTGANDRQNHPDISLVTHVGGKTQITWSINSMPSTTYTLEFFANTASGTPAGKSFIAPPGPPIIAPTDASGNFGQQIQFTGLYDNISVTATDPAGSTSEFSSAVATTPTPDVTVAPNPLTFANTVVGASSGPSAITVTSAGTAPYVINAFDSTPSCYGGPICSTGAFICANTCTTGTPYSPSASCNINVTFSPTVLGTQTTSFYICDNAPGSPRQVTLSGTAVSPPPPTVAPPSFDFGSVGVGGTSTSQTFTVSNPSPTSTTLTPFAVTGPFMIAANTCGATIAAGATCTIDALFAPTAPGSQTGVLSSTAGSGPVSATLTGTGTPPPPTTIGPSSFDFGSIQIGTTSTPGTFTITNPALIAVSLSSFSVTPPFALSSTTCTSTLAASSSCTASVVYSPVATGPASGTISATAGSGTVSAGLVGTGSAAPPANVTVTPPNLDFGSVPVGSASTPTSFQIANPTTSNVGLGVLSTTGPFQILSTTCTSVLPPSSFCAANVKFAPSSIGPASGTLVVPASTGTVTAGLQGTGIAAAPITLSPPGYDFGTALVGTSTASRAFTVTNPGSASVSLSAPSTTGPFAVTSTTCGSSLAAASSCVANVKYTPTANGNQAGQLVVASPAGNATATLVGTGLSQSLLDMPTGTIELGTTTRGGPPVTRVITLRNAGNAALTIDRLSTAAPFSLTHTCPLNLLPGESCNVGIEHNPTTLGDFTGALVVVTNAPGGSRTVPIHVKVQAQPEPIIRVSPLSIGFGGRVDASPAQRITITNDGGADAVGLLLLFNTPHFTFTTNCGPTLAPQSTCFADAVFQPVSFGPKRDTFSVHSNAAGSPHTVSVSGAGCRPSTDPSQSRGGEALNCLP